MTQIITPTPDHNIKRMIEVDGRQVAVPNDCALCWSYWTPSNPGGGARYRSGSLWVCGECLQRRGEPTL